MGNHWHPLTQGSLLSDKYMAGDKEHLGDGRFCSEDTPKLASSGTGSVSMLVTH